MFCILSVTTIRVHISYTFVSGKNRDLTESIKKEIEIMRSLKHKNIVCIQDYIEGPNEIFIIMDLAEGGELFDRIIAKGSYTEKDAAKIIQQVLEACHYLHIVKGLCEPGNDKPNVYTELLL